MRARLDCSRKGYDHLGSHLENYRRSDMTGSAPSSWVMDGPPIKACFNNLCSTSKQNLLRTFLFWAVYSSGGVFRIVREWPMVLSEFRTITFEEDLGTLVDYHRAV